MNQEPVRAYADAETLAADFMDYAYRVAHDLSSPVRGMVEFSSILRSECEGRLEGDAQIYLSYIIENGRKLQAMMDGLLAFSRINTVPIVLTSVDCDALFRQCCIMLQEKISDTRAEIIAGDLGTVTADSRQLAQLFMLLLDNTLKFRQADRAPRIEVAAERKNGFWQLSVRDNGIGILPQHQERIFKLFSRLHTDEEYEGTGIGLTLAQKIVQSHNGQIWCESVPGKGSVFYATVADK